MDSLIAKVRRLPAWSIFAASFAVALIARLLVLWQAHDDPRIDTIIGDGAAYARWAHLIASGDWLGGPDVFYQTPLYPYFLAGLERVGASYLVVRLVQAILGSLACGMIALAAMRLISSRAAGLAAGLLLALYPAAISFDLQLDKPLFDTLFVCALVWSISIATDRPAIWRLLLCGGICGALALTRETALALLPVLIVWAWKLLSAQPAARRIRGGAAIAIGFAIVLAPVVIRNTIVGGRFYMTTAQFGPNFYLGNNAECDGLYRPLKPDRGDALFERIDAVEIAEHDIGRKLAPNEVSQYWTHRTIADIRADPARWISLMFRKFAMTFVDTELADSDVHDRFVVYSPILYVLDATWGFGVLLVLAAAGIVVNWPQRTRLWVLPAMVLVFAAATSLFVIYGRYRLAIVPMLIPLASGALVRGAALARTKEYRTLGMAAVAACAAIGFVTLAERAIPPRGRGTYLYNRAEMFAARNNPGAAEYLYRKAIDRNPRFAAAYCNLGLLLANRNQFDEARSLLAEAIRLEPRDPNAQINMGTLLARQRQLDQAIAYFRAAIQADPGNTAARYNLAAALLLQGKRDEATQIVSSFADPDSTDPFARLAANLLHPTTKPATATSPDR